MGEVFLKRLFLFFLLVVFVVGVFLIAGAAGNNVKHFDSAYSNGDLVTGFVVHPIYSGFSAAESGFVFNNNSKLLSVTDTAVYKIGYYSINGSSWTSFTLAGAAYGTSTVWLTGKSTYTLPAFGAGEHYIIIYSCKYNNGWNCYDNKWQLIVINNAPAPVVPNCNDGKKNGNETGVDCGGSCPVCSPSTGLSAPIWCAFHAIHTENSDGTMTLAESVTAVKSYYNCGSTNDHVEQLDQTQWNNMVNIANANNVDNSFTYFLGGEWSNGQDIHFITMSPYSSPMSVNNANFNTVSKLANWLSQNSGVAQINHPARDSGGTDFSNSANYNEAGIPLVEILNQGEYQWNYQWDCSTGSGCTTSSNSKSPGQTSSGTGWVKYALNKGIHLGFSCGNDDHSDLPFSPTCYVGISSANALTRQAVLNSLKARHTWAAEDKIWMDVRANNYIMGDIFTTSSSSVTINYLINATSGKTISKINLFYNGIIVKSISSSAQNAAGSFTQTLRSGSEDYIFIEAIQSDGSRAWSSPMWIKYSGGTTQVCTPNAIECVSTSVSRQCNSAGTLWVNTNCKSGETCSAGVCSTPTKSCSDDCTTGAKMCSGSGFLTCGNYDSDSCLDWSTTATACGAGQTCTGAGNCGTFTGTIYYISPNGNNGNSGTSSSSTGAWKTLSYACSIAKSGSIIHVMPGNYAESSACNLAVGVSIEGEGPTSVITSTVGSGSTYEFAELYTIKLSSSLLNTAGNQHIFNIKMDGQNTAWGAIGVLSRGNVEISGVTIQNFNAMGVSFDNSEQTSNFAKGNKIHDSTIINSAGYFGGGSQGNIKIIAQDGLQIYNNIITVSSDANGRVSGDPIYGVEGFVKNLKIHDNTITKTFVAGFSKWDFAIEIWNWYEGNEIYNNNIIGSIDIVMSGCDGCAYSAWVHDNTMGQNGLLGSENTRGIDLERYNNDIIIERNLIKNTATGINMNLEYSDADQSNIRMSYNVLYNIGEANTNSKGWGIMYGFGGDPAVSVSNIAILNNVIVGAGAGSGTTMYGIVPPYQGTPSNVQIKNNIVTNFDSAAVYARSGSISGFSMDSNILYGNGINGIGGSSLTSKNTYAVDPKFVSSTDFHLQTGSPAINKGINVGLSLDKDKKTVSNPPEIGAYESP